MSVFLENKEIQKKPDSESSPKSPDSESPKSPTKTKKTDRIFIGTDRKIGEGSFKTVYSCKITDEDNALFELPQGTDENKLCIASIDISKIIRRQTHNDKTFNTTLFNEYIAQPYDKKWYKEELNIRERKMFESIIKKEIRSIEQEIELQKELFQKQLAPQIYDDANDYTNIYYILEEKCGLSLVNYIRMYSDQLENVPENENGTYNYKGTIIEKLPYTDETVFNKIVNLTQKLADAGYINTDLKPENTCTKIGADGSLADIIALDFDPQFFININLSLDKENLLKNAKIFMLTLFIAYLGKWRYIKFVEEIVEKHLTRKKISDMITFFANYQLICLRDHHPLKMLYYYIIGLTRESLTSCIDNQNPEKIKYLTDEICKYIFFGVKNRGGRGKKTKGSKRIKVSKRTKRTKK
jgi:hypothetical protein